MEVAFENVHVLIHEKKISSKQDLIPLLEQVTKMRKPLLIIAEDLGSEALAGLVVSKLRGPLQVAARWNHLFPVFLNFGDTCLSARSC